MFIDYLLNVYGAKKQTRVLSAPAATDSVIATHIAIPKPTDDIDTHGTDSFSESGDESVSVYEKEVDTCWRAKATALSEEVSALKDQLKEQNNSLEQCQETMKREEKIQGERVLMLEMEVVHLIEMQNKVGRYQNMHHRHHVSSIPASAPVAMKEGTHHANLEISALEELSSRVLAERDFLAFKNKNLESLIKEMSDGKCVRDMASRYYRHDGEATGGIIYQLSCTKCNGKHAIIGMTDQDLRSKVMDQFNKVWTLVQKKSGKTDSGDCNSDQTVCRYGQNRFVNHIADHCRNAKEEEVKEWCQKNVKVEILRIELD
mmetsp:Transcript_9315/g.21020  ORF Transcript_9315/g.21020 Transcript_9315/m.21020 type:complete len:317 (-) Transcript_9315:341-1291(-)|eukprot:CAMPEP_0172315830 /NCGR_PEP_ID=MMETSP1058-20130122/26421_1 /TAXON_ID=83371 /ORGANISM="Detonula confervacea, Strain CCMP 353" /LENGTH=316 /DNA_ID=CAMNT_0013030003 /DNA_START=131 /DNA_END=1081 /DNA_ORIENTATION=+